MITTEGHLLGGRVRYRQPANGFRSGLEPVLLAASVPARPGDHVLEAGTGAGAAMLCLSARVPGLHATGVEISSCMAALAEANAHANDFATVSIIAGSLEATSFAHPFDHAMANPPYHAAGGSESPFTDKETAKRGSAALMQTWIRCLSRSLRHRGSLTLIVPTGMVPVCLEAMSRCRAPGTALFPLWPKAGRPAKLILLRGVKNARSPMRLMPGLVLHRPDGGFTDATQAILSDGTALSLDDAAQP